MKTHSFRPRRLGAALALVAAVAVAPAAFAREPFTPAELAKMQEAQNAMVKRGHELWHGARADMSNNGLACANCHPDAAATNPQTFPKFMPMFNRVVAYRDMVNWCIETPQGGKALDGRPVEFGLQTRQTVPKAPAGRPYPWAGSGVGMDK
jgi:thiosulfate dehydrogenase